MGLRPRMLAAVMLVVGIGIGLSRRGGPPPQPDRVRTAAAAAPSGTATNGESRPEGVLPRESPRRSDSPVPASPSRDPAGREDRRFAESSLEAREERIDRDDSFGPNEPGLPFPQEVDSDGGAEDYERYRDGPVARSKPGDAGTDAGPQTEQESALTKRERALEAQGCFPPFSPCRMDTDCCGFSVCRSRPGTISGNFECTPR
ncbi:MAG: hypothetical protein H8E78_09570 [Proteobacteria bacterium]|nr:hypothetical protein [Pseudomonadota bacterium]